MRKPRPLPYTSGATAGELNECAGGRALGQRLRRVGGITAGIDSLFEPKAGSGVASGCEREAASPCIAEGQPPAMTIALTLQLRHHCIHERDGE
jgi:hypothetical protein